MFYTTDIFCIFRKDVQFEKFHKKLNNLHKSINFTYEIGGYELPSLDINIRLTKEEIVTEVHKREIDTDVFLNFSAVAPTSWKRALILWFMNRAKIIASTPKIYEKELKNLKEFFLMVFQ